MPKKILFVITKSNWGGAQRYVFDLATNLPKEQFEVVVAFGGTGLAGAEAGTLERKLKEKNIRTIFVQSFMRDVSPLRDTAALTELRELFKKEKPDVVHLNSSKAGGVGALAARLAGIKNIIFTSHGLAWDEDRPLLARILIYILSRLTFLLCHKVIVLSKDTYKRARRCLACRHKIHLIYNGIGEIPLSSTTSARAELNSHLATVVPGETVWAGTIGELTKNKGYSYLLEAAAILKRKSSRVRFMMIGTGEDEAMLKESIARLGLSDYVHLMGFMPDAAHLLPAFDIFTLTSVKEGLPYVLLEAGKAGCAVVASHIAGNTDIIEHEKSGLLFQSKNAAALSLALEKLIDDSVQRTALGAALTKRVNEIFSLEKMLRETTALYIRS